MTKLQEQIYIFCIVALTGLAIYLSLHTPMPQMPSNYESAECEIERRVSNMDDIHFACLMDDYIKLPIPVQRCGFLVSALLTAVMVGSLVYDREAMQSV